MVHLNLICDHNVAFKRVQDGTNWFSHLREKDVSLMEGRPKITFPVISPEPEIATIIRSHLFNAPIVSFE